MKLANVGTGVPNFDVHTILKYIVLAHETQSTKTTCAIFTYLASHKKVNSHHHDQVKMLGVEGGSRGKGLCWQATNLRSLEKPGEALRSTEKSW